MADNIKTFYRTYILEQILKKSIQIICVHSCCELIICFCAAQTDSTRLGHRWCLISLPCASTHCKGRSLSQFQSAATGISIYSIINPNKNSIWQNEAFSIAAMLLAASLSEIQAKHCHLVSFSNLKAVLSVELITVIDSIVRLVAVVD